MSTQHESSSSGNFRGRKSSVRVSFEESRTDELIVELRNQPTRRLHFHAPGLAGRSRLREGSNNSREALTSVVEEERTNAMVRTLTVVIGLAMSLLVARDASAIPIEITPVDLDSWAGGSSLRWRFDDFRVVQSRRIRHPQTGLLFSECSYDGFDYTYVHHGDPPGFAQRVEAFRTVR